MDPTRTTLIELRDAIAVKQIGAVEAVRAYLERIERLNGRLNAFREVFGDRALERARQVDAGRIVGFYFQGYGDLGTFHGCKMGNDFLTDTACVATEPR